MIFYTITDMEDRVRAIIDIFEYEKAIRAKSDPLRFEAMSYADHRTSLLSAEDSPVKKRRLYSDAGKDAISVLASGFMSALIPQNQEWFSVSFRSRDYRAITEPVENVPYLNYVKQSMLDEFTLSNFYSETSLASLDSMICGYSCELVQENDDEGISYYKTLAPWKCWFDMDTKGNWNIFFYTYSLTGREMIERFPNLNEETRKRALSALNTKAFNIIMAICDKKTVLNQETGSSFFNKGKRYSILHIEEGHGYEVLDETGVDDFPVVIHIWDSVSDSPYGIGIVMKHISSFRKLNELAYEDGVVGAKNANPPMDVPKAMQDSFSDDPKARNYYISSDMRASQVQQSINMEQSLARLQIQENVIRKLCLNDYFSWLTNHESVYTATQVMQVKSEAISQLVPIYGNVARQKISKLLSLTFMNMIKSGRLDKPSDGSLEIEPVKSFNGNTRSGADGNPLMRSRKKVVFKLDTAMAKQLDTYTESNAFTYILESTAAIAQVGKPDVVDNIDFDFCMRKLAVGNGATIGMLKEKRKVDEERSARAEMQAEQIRMQNEMAQSKSNMNNAKAQSALAGLQ